MAPFLRTLAVFCSVAGLSSAAEAACPSLLPPKVSVGTIKRPVTARDLIELRDIGNADSSSFGMPSRLAVSPDGRQIAFSLIRADLAGNGYCLAILVAAIERNTSPRVIDAGGELIPAVDILRGYFVPSGEHAAVIPAWSPDGRTVAFLRRDGGITQLWAAAADGRRSRAVTRSATDVSDFLWSNDGRRLVYATRPEMVAVRIAHQRESRSGWLYDKRVSPAIGPEPLIAGDTPRAIFSVALDGGDARQAAVGDVDRLPPEQIPGVPAPPAAAAIDGRRAITERQGTSLLAPLSLVIADATGRKTPCQGTWCRGGITGLWWQPDGRALYILRREGWNREQIALYRWAPGGKARRIFGSSDDIQDCLWMWKGLVCTRENATTPRRVMVIDVQTGAATDIFDPNPEFTKIELGQVRRLKARNELGLESWADFVLPANHQPGQKLPLVVVQYRSNGFLRGGTGDEYPIHLLAERGFAVISFERPPFVAAAYPNAKSAFEINAIILKDWAERRSTLSALLSEVDQAIATGAVDPARIGITGQSDGASTVQFAMINSRRFAAAAVSSCCFEPKSVTTYAGIAFSDYIQKMGFPGATREDRDFWKANSFGVSGRMTGTPMLMHLADSEYLMALEAFEALREYGKSVELYVFPEEFHVKRQPLHRLAIYNRNLDWFSFWLKSSVDPNPSKQAQYQRWEAMRAVQSASQVP